MTLLNTAESVYLGSKSVYKAYLGSAIVWALNFRSKISKALFGAGEAGTWFSLTGLMAPLVGRSAEILTDPDFNDTTKWDKDPEWTVSGGVATHNGSAASYIRSLEVPLTGEWYEATIVITALVGGLSLYFGQSPGIGLPGVGTHVIVGRSPGTNLKFALRASNASGGNTVVSYFSVRMLTNRAAATLFEEAHADQMLSGPDKPLGFMMDLKRPTVFGPELITDPGFDDTAQWNKDSGWTVSGGKATHANAASSYIRTFFQPVVGQWYQFRVVTGNFSSGAFVIAYAGNSGDTFIMQTPNSSYDFYLRGTGTVLGFAIYGVTGTGKSAEVLSISVREVNGDHAYQTTASSRPQVSSKKNLLVATENVTLGNWSKTGVTVTQETTSLPAGVLATSKISNNGAATAMTISQALGGTNGSAMTVSAKLKAGTNIRYIRVRPTAVTDTTFVEFDLQTGTVVAGTGTITADLNGYWKVSFVMPANADMVGTLSFHALSSPGNLAVAAASGNHFYMTAMQAELGENATRYQRVNSATDYDTAHPMYAEVSVDDSLATVAGGGASTYALIVMGFRTRAIGSAQTLWNDRSGNTGLKLEINSSGNIVFSGGNGSAVVSAVGEMVVAHTDYVVTAIYEDSTLKVQLNNGTVASAACSLVAGTPAITMFKDASGATGLLNGRYYEIIYVKDTPKDADEVKIAKTYIGKLMEIIP